MAILLGCCIYIFEHMYIYTCTQVYIYKSIYICIQIYITIFQLIGGIGAINKSSCHGDFIGVLHKCICINMYMNVYVNIFIYMYNYIHVNI